MAKMTLNFMSEALKRAVSMDVFVPGDHMVIPTKSLPAKNQPYKTLYFLEGLMGNHSGPGNYSKIQGFAEDYNICVAVIGGENKWYSNSDITGEFFTDFVSRDVVNFTRRVFHLSKKPEDTYIGGFSMGGHGAALVGFRHPEIFGKIIMLSGAFHKDAYLSSTEEVTWDLQTKRAYEAALGVKDIQEYIGSENDYEEAAKQTAAREDKPRLFMSCGTKDDLFGTDIAFRDELISLGYDVTWKEYEEAGHSYYTSDLGLEDALKWLELETFVENYPYMTIKADIGVHNLNNWSAWYNVEKASER